MAGRVTPDEPLVLAPMPTARVMTTVDERLVRAPLARIFALAADVERWPALLPHYRYVRFLERRRDGGGIVDMSAYRPFGVVRWPTWWRSRMRVEAASSGGGPRIRFTHVAGVTRGMEVEWTFHAAPEGTSVAETRVRIVHVWDGPALPLGPEVARLVIGPVFVHGIASRTLAGLAAAADRGIP